MTSKLASDGKQVTPTPVPPSSYTENHSLPSFHSFPLLPQDLKIYILTFVAKASIEDPIVQTSPLTHVLPLVSREFRDMCRSNCLWQTALEQLVEAEPYLWKDGLLQLQACEASSSSELVRAVHRGLREPGYFRLFRMVVARFVRFTSPVYCMTRDISLGQPLRLNLFEPALIQLEAGEGRRIAAEDLPQFVYAHAAPFSTSSPACLVNVQWCRINENGTADLRLIPVAHVKMELCCYQWNAGRLLMFAQCLRLEASHRVEPRSLVVGNDARERRRFGSCSPCCIQ